MTDATYYKKRFELSETKREAEASISAKKIQLWQDAYTALLAASTGKAEDWREAIARLLDVIYDLEEDGDMYEEMLKNRDKIIDGAYKDGAYQSLTPEQIEKIADVVSDGLGIKPDTLAAKKKTTPANGKPKPSKGKSKSAAPA